jgi:membrane-bound lytic murein transglycosylase D
MPATGRLYDLTVSGGVDERRDPIAATRSAARFLRHNYQMLEGQWPLALTAYNHGPAGMRRAINETGTTDIGVIVQRYRGPAFGFASRNFYAEFLAALDVEKHHRAYFGDLRFGVREPTRVVSLERPLGIEVAARLARVERDQLAALNPALLSPVVEGRQSIPAGYALRMPASGGQGFEDRLAELVAEEKVVRVASPAPPTRRGRSARSVASGRRQGRSEGVAAVRRRGSGDRPRSGAATKSKGAPKRGQTTRGSRRS